ncbi:VIT1/CCC1 transporter family protein [Kingella kingae]|uniref:VIT1/CCC1 transporter family protein n=1 Tax=Kingella kingae TaxID=504 RepID=UPI0009B770E0|nr:VIT1/CCC1 transporter family protein [Kingella kingae]MDK4547718.1 VIT1/CCC1 transporter family protein [Kingella kingae]MDK4622880.1 VIT1/CCC1 transporter family protein [Kingella kingae]
MSAHARDEIGLSDTLAANPLQAALSSAGAFCVGAIVPVLVVTLLPYKMTALGITTILGLVILGAVSAKLGGAKILPAVRRIVLWGIVTLAVTMLLGKL